jgi:hypothetical protein
MPKQSAKMSRKRKERLLRLPPWGSARNDTEAALCIATKVGSIFRVIDITVLNILLYTVRSLQWLQMRVSHSQAIVFSAHHKCTVQYFPMLD